MKKILLSLILLFSTTAFAEPTDSDYKELFIQVWDECTGHSRPSSISVDDVLPGSGRWDRVQFIVAYTGKGFFTGGTFTKKFEIKARKDGSATKSALYSISDGQFWGIGSRGSCGTY